MKLRCTLVTAVIAITAAVGAGFAPAHASSVAAPDTMKVSCASSKVWLRISASAGQNCYTGAGSLQVDLQDVSGAQVIGAHLACLTFSTGSGTCIQGPGTVRFQPPPDVTGISLD